MHKRGLCRHAVSVCVCVCVCVCFMVICVCVLWALSPEINLIWFDLVHGGMYGGHMGIRRTIEQVQKRGYWRYWRRDVRRFCRQCQTCAEYFRGQLPRTAHLQPLLTGAPFERLHIDLTGPHPRSRRGSVYIVTCIDPFTKWAEAFPAPNKEAATVARIIVEQIICRFGCPIAILSDQGKEVDGNLMAEICFIHDQWPIMTSYNI